MLIQERLTKLQEWASTGIRLVELPTVEEYGAAESELALLQYCYYRLIHHIAGNIKDNPNYDVHELVDVFLSSPFGGCVSKECVVSLCELLMTSELRCYCRRPLFPQGWTADDVAGSIHSVKGGTKDLLKAAIEDSKDTNSSGGTTHNSTTSVLDKSKLRTYINQILSDLNQGFAPNELAYLGLQSKYEGQIRDKFCWRLQCIIDANHGANSYVVRREWPSLNDTKKINYNINTYYSTSTLTPRSKVDVAILKLDNNTEVEDVLALIEFKAHMFLNDEEWPYWEFGKDVEKMYNLCSLVNYMPTPHFGMNPDLYFIFLHGSPNKYCSNYKTVVQYLDILNCMSRSGQKHCTLCKSIMDKTFINRMKSYWKKFFQYPFTATNAKTNKTYKIDIQTAPSAPNPHPQYIGESFGYGLYCTPMVWGPVSLSDIIGISVSNFSKVTP